MLHKDEEILHHLKGIHTGQKQLEKILRKQTEKTICATIWTLGNHAMMIPEEVRRKFTEIDMEELAKAREVELLFTPKWAVAVARQVTTEKAIQQVHRAIQAYDKEEKKYE